MLYQLKKYFFKYTNKNKYAELKEKNRDRRKIKRYNKGFYRVVERHMRIIQEQSHLNFLHSGHLGDIIYSLPVIQELSKTHTCSLFIQVNKPIDIVYHRHPSGNVFLSDKIADKLLPLLQNQPYLKEVKKYNTEEIHINLDEFRNLPLDLKFLTTRWYSQFTGVFPDLTEPFLSVEEHPSIKNKVVVLRSFRWRNNFLNYRFLNQYPDVLFIGLPNEYEDFKKEVPNAKYYDPKDFFEMAQIIRSCRFFVGNQSFAFSLAEALKVPRILEACPHFPVVYPIGGSGADVYFQPIFEQTVEKFFALTSS